jgi:hypothetical protein
MTSHLSEEAVEALAHDRSDLVDEAERAHARACEPCLARVEEARALSFDFAQAFAAHPAEGEVDALVRAAMSQAEVAEPPPSRRSVVLSGVAAAFVAMAGGALWLGRVPSPAAAIHLLEGLWAAITTLDRAVETVVPGGWSVLALIGASALGILALPMRALLQHAAGPTVAAALLLGLSLPTTTAEALDFEGTWPEGERVSVRVHGEPTTAALRKAAKAAGLGLVASLPDERSVTIMVDDVPLRDVVQGVLGDADLVVERTGALLIVRAPSASEPEPVGAPKETRESKGSSGPPVAAASEEESAPAEPERVTFGRDIHVRPGERVAEVVTFGGDVRVDGEVVGDVVTMMGDITVGPRGSVGGEIVTLGGELTVAESADVPAGQVVLGPFGEVREGDQRKARVDGLHHDGPNITIRAEGQAARDGPFAEGSFLRELFGDAAKHALLFLLGLLLLGLAPTRFGELKRAIVRAPGRNFAMGFLGLLGALVLMVVLAITLIGIPAALVLGLATYLAYYVGLVAAAAVLGAALPLTALHDRPVLQLFAGIAALFVLALVPVVGTLLSVLAALVGLGAVVLTRMGGRPLPA